MFKLLRGVMASGILLAALLLLPVTGDAHAAFVRSEPAAGVALNEPPTEIRIWFSEPLERSYTGADLLDGSGAKISGVSVEIAPDDAHQLVVTPPVDLPDGVYTVAWRTLSAADGHTLEGYFGFRIGAGSGGVTASGVSDTSQSDPWRGLSRGLALIGLAALLAIAPLTLWVFDPLRKALPALGEALPGLLRRYAILSTLLALTGSTAALIAQATAIVPGAPISAAIGQTLGDTRYGWLWLIRLALLIAIVVLLALALRARERRRVVYLTAAALLSLVTPLPFSMLSHAAAQPLGDVAAVAGDALHLLAASIWAGGLFMLALALLPALLAVAPERRLAALRLAIPRFSAIGLAAWGVLVLSGLYASWLQVGTLEALRDTDYGQALLLKGLLLLPALALAALHFLLGWRGLTLGDVARVGKTFALEALLVVAVLVVVGRLIGLEPAREGVANRTPAVVTFPLSFATNDGQRSGRLTIAPGVPGDNRFTIALDGAVLPAEAVGVLRFSLPSQEIGQQELSLLASGENQFSAEGSELALPGEWQITAIVRQIGSFSWTTDVMVPVGLTAPAAAEPNPPPRFDSAGAVGMIAIAIGICALAMVIVARGAALRRRGVLAAVGIVGVVVGTALLNLARLPELDAADAASQEIAATAPSATARAASPEAMSHEQHATPLPQPLLAAAGTPVAAGDLEMTLEVDPAAGGAMEAIVIVSQGDGVPLAGARVAVVTEMAGMSGPTERAATETVPGRYLVSDLALSMAGEWRLTVRISPKGASTQVIPFAVTVP